MHLSPVHEQQGTDEALEEHRLLSEGQILSKSEESEARKTT